MLIKKKQTKQQQQQNEFVNNFCGWLEILFFVVNLSRNSGRFVSLKKNYFLLVCIKWAKLVKKHTKNVKLKLLTREDTFG